MAFEVDPSLGDAHEDLAWAVVEAAPDAMFVTDSRGVIVLANRQACELFGYTPGSGSLVGRSVDELLPASLRRVHRSQRERYGRDPHRREMGSGLELLGLRSDGSEVPVEVSLSPVSIAARHYVIAAVRDVTAKREASALLHEARARVVLADDRERIARDLHDSVIQRLYGAGLSLEVALGANAEQARASMQNAVSEIDGTISELRTVIHDLHHDDGHVSSLAERLRKVTEAQAIALEIDVVHHVVGRPEADVAGPVADAVIAVVREAIANAHRHGDARAVVVDLEVDIDGMVRVVVSDNGGGFDPATITRGYGLDNLAARAAELGGSCTIESMPGHGTSIDWVVPQQGGNGTDHDSP